jgi:hypothetical protein
MPSPVAQIVALASSLRTAPTLKGFVKAQQVLLGRGKLSSDWSEAQIVIYPVSGKFTGPHNLETAGLDVTRSVAVRLRGKDFDQLGELEERFFQALWYRSAGGPSESPTPATPGPFWQAIAEDWVTDPDSSSAGEEVTVFITVVDSIDYVPPCSAASTPPAWFRARRRSRRRWAPETRSPPSAASSASRARASSKSTPSRFATPGSRPAALPASSAARTARARLRTSSARPSRPSSTRRSPRHG